jgi:molybdopterin-guanine dinucleotide biosynthesis protein A
VSLFFARVTDPVNVASGGRLTRRPPAANASRMASERPSVAGVLLAGGRATRMGGRDKAFAAVDGEPIAVRTVRLLHALFPQVIVSTHRPERFRGLDVETVGDVYAGCGPLAGIHSAMLASRRPWVFVVACDMPGLDAGVIRWLLARPRAGDAVVPRWDNDVEPLHALYAVHTLPTVERCLADGRWAMREFLPRLRVDYVHEDELRAQRGAAQSLLNVNTPEELAALGGRFDEAER